MDRPRDVPGSEFPARPYIQKLRRSVSLQLLFQVGGVHFGYPTPRHPPEKWQTWHGSSSFVLVEPGRFARISITDTG
jgi:hypothetical protein